MTSLRQSQNGTNLSNFCVCYGLTLGVCRNDLIFALLFYAQFAAFIALSVYAVPLRKGGSR